ncbi:MAG: hypothetical protein E7490_07815 [Ruminococcaceae bacterium]|nr:hypothetical protein [Oscillospiraceae bacterium]
MKKLRKIVAAVLGAATVATVATITASAARANVKFGAVTPTYYKTDNTVNYTELKPSYCENTVSFSSVSKKLKEGNVVFAVDFTEPGDDIISDETFDEIDDYMASLRLDKRFMFYMGAGYDGCTTYPLEVVNGLWNEMNVIVGSPTIYRDKFDITSATAQKLKSSSFYRLTFDYKIKGHNIIPDFWTALGTEASNPYFYDVKFNDIFGYNKSTTGKLQMDISSENIGKTLPLWADHTIVGYITISSSGKVTFKNC